MEAWEKSGLTQKEYCKQNELKLATFGLWRKRLHKPKQEGMSFIDAGLRAQEEVPAAKMALQLLLPNGVRLGLSEHVSESLLQQVLHFSGALRCFD
jgi:hypothetical protein